jgi:hypothetical protein
MPNYLLISVAVVVLVLAALWATGGVAFFVLLPIMRLVPIAAGIFASLAVAIMANQLQAGSSITAMFAIPVMLFALMPLMSYLPGSSWRIASAIFYLAPVLSIFPALALWQLAKDLARRT